ncbi:MAG TPA: WecB/TagA/CpsF family glycosyltransferase [Solirubrobacteraceae bacterium]|nr:WecB/TagA/CpsF family glycosyltransferase [Solirubrobacteraceae bacterium]
MPEPDGAPASAPRPPGAVPAPPARAEVLGVPLAISSYDEVLDWMDATVACGARGSITAAAVNLLICARDEPATMQAVRDLTLAVPDGQPLVWSLRALGHTRATRVYGPELMLRWCARAAGSGTPAYLYGGRDDRARALLERRLSERFPALRIAGGCSPRFRPIGEPPLTPSERERVIADIDCSGAQVVWVGTGQPRQELWMSEMRPLLKAPLLVGVGAAFDFHAGLVSQAPAWMGDHGLEWLYRLSREPRRLWRRYLLGNPRFLAAFACQYARSVSERR